MSGFVGEECQLIGRRPFLIRLLAVERDAQHALDRLDELQAAILRAKLPHLDHENLQRQQLARIYHTRLSGNNVFRLPQTAPDATHVYHQYVIRTPQRDALRAWLRERGIGTLIHYPLPVHLQPAYATRLTSGPALPATEAAAAQIISLPMYPELTPAQVNTVAGHLLAWADTNPAA